MAKQDITVCIDAYPRPGHFDVFRIGAADDILRLLVDAHDTEFSIPELVDATPRVLLGRRSGGAVDPSTVSTPSRFEKRLNATTSRSTQTVSRRTTRSLASLNQNSTRRSEHSSTASKPRPPTPTTSTTSLGSSSLEASLGEADRQSDIDCFVVVDGNRTTARRQITDVVADLQSERFDGDRFVFEPYVESAESAGRAGSKLHEIFTEGITEYTGATASTRSAGGRRR